MHIAERHSLEQIQQLAKEQADARARVQLQAIVLAKQGRSAPDVARTLGQGRRTVQQWVHDYNRGGVEALQDRRGPGHARGTTATSRPIRSSGCASAWMPERPTWMPMPPAPAPAAAPARMSSP